MTNTQQILEKLNKDIFWRKEKYEARKNELTDTYIDLLNDSYNDYPRPLSDWQPVKEYKQTIFGKVGNYAKQLLP